MKRVMMVLASGMLLLGACKKDKHDEVSKENMVGTYKLTAWVSKTGSQPEENEYAQMDACEKDDLTKLNADMSYNVVDAGTVCNPDGNENGTWSLPSSSQLILNGNTFTIQSFKGKTLILTSSLGSGDNMYVSTATLTKQ